MTRQCLFIGAAAVLLAAAHSLVAEEAGPALDPQKTYSEEEAWRIGWPFENGPFGNYLTLRTGVRIADDLLQAQMAWESEDHDFGSAKTGSKTFSSAEDITARLGPDALVHPGNWAGVIVAEGKVFGSSFRPAGKLYQAEVKGETARFRLDAEDILIALDARTGKTLWKAVEAGGIILSGGKRGGFQVAPAYWRGKVFSMGSTGRLFAYDAAAGRKLWQGDIGPGYKQASKERDQILAAAAQGRWTDPDGPGWHTSLIVADGVLVVPTYSGRDTALRGIDVETGQMKWELKEAVSKYATPNVWRHAGREYVLCATVGGVLRLIDPRNGKELWKVTGLGPNYFTLAPSAKHVLVNAAGPVDPKEKRVPGYYGAYRITPAGAERAWVMPEETRNQIPTWFDSCARQRYLIRDGLAYVPTEGTREAPGRFLLLDEATGRILAEHANVGDEVQRADGLFYLVEDRLFFRSNSCHGPTHGGRHPIVEWTAAPGKVTRLDHEGGLCALDVAEFATAYEVYMETPVVAGRMFERTIDGGLVCYDLRQPEGLSTWSLDLRGGYVGLPSLPVRLWTRPDGAVYGGRVWPPTDRDAGVTYSQCRRFQQWERVTQVDAKAAGDRLTGTVRIGFGSHTWPVRVDLTRSEGAVTGTWTRRITALEQPISTSGTVGGYGPSKERTYPTPWLPDKPVTSFGENLVGISTWVLQLAEPITWGKKPAGLTICLDHDGAKVVRAAATAYAYTRAWHEVDPTDLQVKDGRITGTAMVVLNGDWWVTPNPAEGTGIAGRIELDVTSTDGNLTGTYKAGWGIPWTATGQVFGKFLGGK